MKFTNKKILFAIIALFIVALIPFIQSCSNNEDVPMQESKQLEYLDVDVSNLQNPTEAQKLILKKAFGRVDSYVIYNNIYKKYCLSIGDGQKINISDRLFSLAQATMNQTNEYLKNENVVIDKNDSKILHVVKKIDYNQNISNNKVRFKIAPQESTAVVPVPVPVPVNTTTIKCSWYYLNLYLSNASLNAYCYGAGSAGSLGIETPIGIPLVLSAALSGMVASQNPTGVILHFSGYAPFWTFDGMYQQNQNNNAYFNIP